MRGRDIVAIIIILLIIWLYWKSKKAVKKTRKPGNAGFPPVAGVPCCGGPPPIQLLRKKRGK